MLIAGTCASWLGHNKCKWFKVMLYPPRSFGVTHRSRGRQNRALGAVVILHTMEHSAIALHYTPALPFLHSLLWLIWTLSRRALSQELVCKSQVGRPLNGPSARSMPTGRQLSDLMEATLSVRLQDGLTPSQPNEPPTFNSGLPLCSMVRRLA